MINKLKKLFSFLSFTTIGGLLGALGGTDGISKGVRRIGIPLVITLYALYIMQNWWVLTIMSMAGILSIGYGIPCFIPGWEDEGSTLGGFWYELTSKMGANSTKTYLFANILTRGSIGLFISLSTIVVPILKGNWIIYGLCSIGIIISYAMLSWRDLGTFKFKNKQLLWAEFLPFSIIVILAQIIIKY